MAIGLSIPLAPKMQREWIAALHEQVPILQRALETTLMGEDLDIDDRNFSDHKIAEAMKVLCAFDVAMGSYVVPKGGN